MKTLALSVLRNIRLLLSRMGRINSAPAKGGGTASWVQADVFVVSRERKTCLSRLCFQPSPFLPEGERRQNIY